MAKTKDIKPEEHYAMDSSFRLTLDSNVRPGARIKVIGVGGGEVMQSIAW